MLLNQLFFFKELIIYEMRYMLFKTRNLPLTLVRQGNELILSSIKSVSDEVVGNLAKFRGALTLTGIQQISEAHLEVFFAAIEQSRGKERQLSVILCEKLWNNGDFDSLFTKYAMNKDQYYLYAVGQVYRFR
jgi:hypothetical protein